MRLNQASNIKVYTNLYKGLFHKYQTLRENRCTLNSFPSVNIIKVQVYLCLVSWEQ
jgi:hypothetical protein